MAGLVGRAAAGGSFPVVRVGRVDQVGLVVGVGLGELGALAGLVGPVGAAEGRRRRSSELAAPGSPPPAPYRLGRQPVECRRSTARQAGHRCWLGWPAMSHTAVLVALLILPV